MAALCTAGGRRRGKEAYEAHTKRAPRRQRRGAPPVLRGRRRGDAARFDSLHAADARVRAPTGKGTHLDGPSRCPWTAARSTGRRVERRVAAARARRAAGNCCAGRRGRAATRTTRPRSCGTHLVGCLPCRDADGKLSAKVAGRCVSLLRARRRPAARVALPFAARDVPHGARGRGGCRRPSASGCRRPCSGAVRGAPLADAFVGRRVRGQGRGPASSRRRRRGAASASTRGSSAPVVLMPSVGAALLEAARGDARRGWPCVLSASTEVVAPGRCRFLDDDVASLPGALRGALEAARRRPSTE